MKRLLVIMLLLVHTAASSGMVLSAHYCMGSLSSVTIGHKVSNKCAKCGMHDKKCCHDDQKLVKLENSHLIQSATIHFNVEVPVIDYTYFSYVQDLTTSNSFFYKKKTEKYITPPIYLRCCNFRI